MHKKEDFQRIDEALLAPVTKVRYHSPPDPYLWHLYYSFLRESIPRPTIPDVMNMGYQYSNKHGRRITKSFSLRILEFMFDPSKNDYTTCIVLASTSKSRVEFDRLSYTQVHALSQGTIVAPSTLAPKTNSVQECFVVYFLFLNQIVCLHMTGIYK